MWVLHMCAEKSAASPQIRAHVRLLATVWRACCAPCVQRLAAPKGLDWHYSISPLLALASRLQPRQPRTLPAPQQRVLAHLFARGCAFSLPRLRCVGSLFFVLPLAAADTAGLTTRELAKTLH